MSTEETKPKKSFKLEKKTLIFAGGGLAGAAAIAITVAMLMPKPHGSEVAHAQSEHESTHEEPAKADDHHKVDTASHATPGLLTRVLLTYSDAIDSTEKKLQEMRRLHEDNLQLRAENARLKHQVLTAKYETQKKNAIEASASAVIQIEKQTGSKVGRIIASIAYEVPQNVPYAELFTLGVHYFKGKEDEKAAKIFAFLGDHGGEKYKTVDHAFLTGVTLYRIDALDEADRYFDAVLKGPNDPSIKGVKTQARLWRALIHDKKNHKFKSQYWIRELLDQDPKSEEAAWVSGYRKPVLDTEPVQHAEVSHSETRAPASTDAEDTHKEDAHKAESHKTDAGHDTGHAKESGHHGH